MADHEITITVADAIRLRDGLQLLVEDLNKNYPQGLPHVYERVQIFLGELERSIASDRLVGHPDEYTMRSGDGNGA